MKKIFLLFTVLLLIGCVPPAEELAGVEPEVEEVEEVEIETVEQAEEEIKKPVEDVKEEVKNETTVNTTQPIAIATCAGCAWAAPWISRTTTSRPWHPWAPSPRATPSRTRSTN